MERFITLSRQDPAFVSYLDGTFSRTHRALPIRSMNVETAGEEVTFELAPLSEIRRPGTFRLIWTLMRPWSLVFSLGPMLVTWLYGWGHGAGFDAALVLSALFAVLVFHSGLNVLDDYFDHRGGRDRLNPRGGSRAIQNGWVRARTLRDAGLALLALAAIGGLPVLLAKPGLSFGIALVALVSGLGFSSRLVRLKSRGLGEVTTFLLAGPLLTLGFSWATSDVVAQPVQESVIWAYALLGCAFGFAAVTYYHLKNIENIMIDSQINARTLAVRLGFDAAKRSVWLLAALSAISTLAFGVRIGAGPLFAGAATVQTFLFILIARQVSAAPSPLSGELREARRWGLRAHWATTGVLGVCIVIEARDRLAAIGF